MSNIKKKAFGAGMMLVEGTEIFPICDGKFYIILQKALNTGMMLVKGTEISFNYFIDFF